MPAQIGSCRTLQEAGTERYEKALTLLKKKKIAKTMYIYFFIFFSCKRHVFAEGGAVTHY